MRSPVTYEVHTLEVNEDNGRRFRSGTVRARNAQEAKDLAAALNNYYAGSGIGIRPIVVEAFVAFYDYQGKFMRVPVEMIETVAREMGFITHRERRDERRAERRVMDGSADNPVVFQKDISTRHV